MAVRERLGPWGKAAAATYGIVLAIGLPLVTWVIYRQAAYYYEPVLRLWLIGLPIHAALTAPVVTAYILIAYRVLRFIPALIARAFKGGKAVGVIVIAAIAGLPALWAGLNGEPLIASAMAVMLIAAFLAISRITGGQTSTGELAWGKAVLATLVIALAGCAVGLTVDAAEVLATLEGPRLQVWFDQVGFLAILCAVAVTAYILIAYAALNFVRRRILRLAKDEDAERGVFLIGALSAAPAIGILWLPSRGPFAGIVVVVAGLMVVGAFAAIWRFTRRGEAPAGA